MSNLQRVHKLIQKLCVVKSDNRVSVREISVNLPGREEEVVQLLRQLGDLKYIEYSKCGEYVRLTETGLRTQVPYSSDTPTRKKYSKS